jgi:hypothetical protein
MSAVMEYADVTDRSKWPSGPWDGEPDKRVWVDEATDLDCMIRRGPSGVWCGYVGVPPSHPWHGKGYAECAESIDHDGDGTWSYCDHSPSHRLDVHGGLTYADSCDDEGNEATAICHVPQPGREADVWWFGFDCGHSWDESPAYRYGYGGTYKDIAYVTRECERLAEQLSAVSR